MNELDSAGSVIVGDTFTPFGKKNLQGHFDILETQQKEQVEKGLEIERSDEKAILKLKRSIHEGEEREAKRQRIESEHGGEKLWTMPKQAFVFLQKLIALAPTKQEKIQLQVLLLDIEDNHHKDHVLGKIAVNLVLSEENKARLEFLVEGGDEHAGDNTIVEKSESESEENTEKKIEENVPETIETIEPVVQAVPEYITLDPKSQTEELARLKQEIREFNQSLQENTYVNLYGKNHSFNARETSDFIEKKVIENEQRVKVLEGLLKSGGETTEKKPEQNTEQKIEKTEAEMTAEREHTLEVARQDFVEYLFGYRTFLQERKMKFEETMIQLDASGKQPPEIEEIPDLQAARKAYREARAAILAQCSGMESRLQWVENEMNLLSRLTVEVFSPLEKNIIEKSKKKLKKERLAHPTKEVKLEVKSQEEKEEGKEFIQKTEIPQVPEKQSVIDSNIATVKLPVLSLENQFGTTKKEKETRRQYGIEFERALLSLEPSPYNNIIHMKSPLGMVLVLQKKNDIELILHGRKIGHGYIEEGKVSMTYDEPQGYMDRSQAKAFKESFDAVNTQIGVQRFKQYPSEPVATSEQVFKKAA